MLLKSCSNPLFAITVLRWFVFGNNLFHGLPPLDDNQDDSLLVIGWGTSVKIASIRTNPHKVANGTYNHIPASTTNQVDIVASFQTSYYISGIAPFGDSLVVLAYIPGEEDGEKDFSSNVPSRQVLTLKSTHCCQHFCFAEFKVQTASLLFFHHVWRASNEELHV